MRFIAWWLALSAMLVGCAGPKSKSADASGQKDDKKIVTPDRTLTGKVVRVVPHARFAVLNFPVGKLPTPNQQLNVYRQGLKVGEVKATGPQQDDNVVADITNGDAQVGDEVRGD